MNAQGASIPSSETLAEAALHTDISLLEIDEANCTVRISDPDASIDVGALGKGYATEKAAEALRAMGAESYVLNVGGNIRIIGTKPDGGKWLTGIKDPADPDASYALYLNLANTSCVTSGSYERFFTVGGTRYHHIIDKDTGMPATYFPSVTIIAESSALADALSTALFCMPLEDGLALIASIPNAEALWILSDGSQHMSDGLQQYVTEPK